MLEAFLDAVADAHPTAMILFLLLTPRAADALEKSVDIAPTEVISQP